MTPIALSPHHSFAQECPDYPVPISWHVLPPNPCPGDYVRVVFTACGPCIDLREAIMYSSPYIVVRATMNRAQCDIEVCTIDSVTFDLGRLEAGFHQYQVIAATEVIRGDSACTLVDYDNVRFTVCGLTGPLPYIEDVIVGDCGRDPCPDEACPNQYIQVRISGTFPDDCHVLKRIEVVPSDSTVVGPPTLRLLVDDMACLGRVCTPGPFLWREIVYLPPLPPGLYQLPMELGKTTCSDSFPDSVATVSIPFQVLERCSTFTNPCFQIFWGGDKPHGICDATVGPGDPGVVHLEIAPRVPLAALQGELMLGDRLRITNLEPIGHASGMRLTWRPTYRGARFVMFADNGAPIPPYLNRDLNGWPVLGITVEPIPGVPIPDRSSVFAYDLLGSDSLGLAVYGCPVIHRESFSGTICAGTRCDVNGDAVADVRDLVLMVRCVLNGENCPDTAVIDLDCDDNGSVALEDVLCCARFMLNRDIPDSVGIVRPEPGVNVQFGELSRTATEMIVPLTLHGADRVGAARLALSFPADRYDVTGIEILESQDWLKLHEVRGGNVVVGLIGLNPQVNGPEAVEMVVRLTLKSGQPAGGEVRVVESQFSGRDGIGLEVDLGQPMMTLPSVAPIALSRGQPNPFSANTRFTVTLAAPGNLDVAVHDLSGRRVRSLVREHVAFGTRELAWDGRDDGGRLAASGVYFIRATASGSMVSNRVVLLREQ